MTTTAQQKSVSIHYDEDFYAWAMQQANFIKLQQFDKLDIEHLYDEVESMGKSQQSELSSRLEVLLMHLLKWKYQPTFQGHSWKCTIKEQKKRIKSHLKSNPSLKNPNKLKDTFDEAYQYAIYEAMRETGLSEKTFPPTCEWTIDQVLNDEFYPN